MYIGTWAWVTRSRANGELEMLHGRKYPEAKFGAGMWSCPGGGREADESLERCIQRETEEEFGITPDMATARKAAVITYSVRGAPFYELHSYHIPDFVGAPRPTKEMVEVRWFAFAELPFEQMYEDCERIYRRFLAFLDGAPPFRANVCYQTRKSGLILPIEILPL